MDERALRQHLAALRVGPLIKQRQWLNAPCPLAPWTHRSGHDRNPSFGVKITTGEQSHYYCFTCKHTGRVHDLAAELGRLRGEDYRDIIRQAFRDDIVSVAEYEYQPESQELTEPLDSAIYGDLYDLATSHDEAMEYLDGRGISAATVRRLHLMYDEEEKRIVFAVKDRRGNLYGYTGRSILPASELHGRNPKVRDYLGLPKRHLLLGEERVERGKPVIVVEGLFAYARLIEIGTERLASVVALLGSEMTDPKVERLQRINEPVYLLVDDDEAGDVCLWGVVRRDGAHDGRGAVSKLRDHVPLYIPEYPEGVADVDDFEIEDVEHILEVTEPHEFS
jgi:DNA primase